MKSIVAKVVRALLLLVTRRSYSRFMASLSNPRKVQLDLLEAVLADMSDTDYGRHLKIRKNLSLEDFRKLVPIISFEDDNWRRFHGKQCESPSKSILSPGGVKVFERTSGSSGNVKLIPYNAALLNSFETYFKVWMHDILKFGPKFRTFTIFLSMSPSVNRKSESDQSGIKVGFSDDTEYLSPVFRFILNKILAVPMDFSNADSDLDFFDDLAIRLLKRRDLEIISIWHPSYFQLIWQRIFDKRHFFADYLRKEIQSENHNLWKKQLELLSSFNSLHFNPKLFWPELKFISAWGDGYSSFAFQALIDLVHAPLTQRKGLLATEAPLTIPLVSGSCLPFITEVFFEFIDDGGTISLVDELKVGHIYSVLVTQRGGLIRYNIGDLVHVKKVLDGGLPNLEFIGREGDVSDLVGEKLNGAYISAQISSFQAKFPINSICFLPVQSDSTNLPKYMILFDISNLSEMELPAEKESLLEGIEDWWDHRLSESFHYGYARKINQLGRAKARCVPGLATKLVQFEHTLDGRKLGDIKPKVLLKNMKLSRTFLETL